MMIELQKYCSLQWIDSPFLPIMICCLLRTTANIIMRLRLTITILLFSISLWHGDVVTAAFLEFVILYRIILFFFCCFYKIFCILLSVVVPSFVISEKSYHFVYSTIDSRLYYDILHWSDIIYFLSILTEWERTETCSELVPDL